MIAPHSLPRRLHSAAGLQVQLLANGAIRRFDAGELLINLFPGNEVEGAPANLWLRRHGPDGTLSATPLLGPLSPLHWHAGEHIHGASGEWQGLHLRLQLRLAESAKAWFWHLQVENRSGTAAEIDLLMLQDIALAPYATVRINEHYVSHYLDLSPLDHPQHGCLLAARQNLAVKGLHPWALVGSLRRACSYATDGLQVLGLALREGGLPKAVLQGLPGSRLQHEHSMLALQDEPLSLQPGQQAALGFFGLLLDDHPEASSAADLSRVAEVLALPEARPGPLPSEAGAQAAPSLFASAPLLASEALSGQELDLHFGSERRHAEFEQGELLSFFKADAGHVVLRAKELRLQRPHGHILRSGRHLVPDESALTSTVWMGGVFHSMLTQGHVSFNRGLSTQRSWLGLYRSQGLRLFIDAGASWHQLGLPSAFEINENADESACRWLYKHATGLIEVRSEATAAPDAMRLQVRVLAGAPVRLLLSLHLALGGDDGGGIGALLPTLRRQGKEVLLDAPQGSELAARFPGGGFTLDVDAASPPLQLAGDELLYADGRSRSEPFACMSTEALSEFGITLRGRLIQAEPAAAGTVALPTWRASAASALQSESTQLADILPWYRHNALVHYLSPRGLEQYTGGGWGTRDVCQGPLEMLLALGHVAPVRDLLLRVFSAQNPDGDWPQWFMFFDRDARIRAGDSHGDIVFWPLLGLARYLLASKDAAALDEPLPFFGGDSGTLWQHVQRALALIRQRCIPGTKLVAYWHGDWNDSLQPADPALRERLCSAWTVTLHHQMLASLARALLQLGRADEAIALQAEAAAVLADFQRLLVVDGVVTGYALFPERPGTPELLLHPQDRLTGVHFSLLPMMHAVLEEMLSPEQARAQLALIERHLSGPDGARLFDAPMPYRGGPERLFQRAESSAFFGREIGVMYMHAHLRFAEMLAHLGEAGRFFAALGKAHPIALRERTPSASLRQANCYFSSSDAGFADRYEASAHYAQALTGEVPLDGGWRIYSSGPGIAIGLIVQRFLGWQLGHAHLTLDPVIPSALDGLTAQIELQGFQIELAYRVGPLGHGPLALQLNGRALAFERASNLYRLGGARLPLPALLQALQAGRNMLEIEIG